MNKLTHSDHSAPVTPSPDQQVEGAKLPAPQPLKDPVCGMTVTDQAEHRHEHAGQFYYFCSAKCQGMFAADPLHYVVAARTAEASPTEPSAIEGAIFTCPMHPEVHQDHAGNCSKCGMTLEPATLFRSCQSKLKVGNREKTWTWNAALPGVGERQLYGYPFPTFAAELRNDLHRYRRA